MYNLDYPQGNKIPYANWDKFGVYNGSMLAILSLKFQTHFDGCMPLLSATKSGL